jgi:uncharacterized protein (DUF2147 family)
MLRVAFVLLATALFAAPPVAQDPTPIGVWLHPNERIRVEIAPCGEALCGKLVWFKWPNDRQGLPLTDVKNADAKLRSRPLLGLTILHGLRRVGERTWAGGKIYNPDDGVDYNTRMSIDADGSLQVRAYVLIPLIGKTFVWRRVR